MLQFPTIVSSEDFLNLVCFACGMDLSKHLSGHVSSLHPQGALERTSSAGPLPAAWQTFSFCVLGTWLLPALWAGPLLSWRHNQHSIPIRSHCAINDIIAFPVLCPTSHIFSSFRSLILLHCSLFLCSSWIFSISSLSFSRAQNCTGHSRCRHKVDLYSSTVIFLPHWLFLL